MRSEIFEKLSLPRLFARCVLPGSVSMAAGALYVVVDGMFVGHCMGHDSLAAANMMWPLLGVMFALSSMISTGSSVKISNYLGRRERDKACRMFTVSVCLEIALGLFMCASGFLLTRPFLELLGAPEATQELCRSYIRSYLIFGPLVCLYYSINGYLRVSGMQRYSMWLNVGASLLNLVLDYVFIVVLRQGIWCASFTTCVSLSAGAAAGFAPFLMGRTDIRFVRGTVGLGPLKRMMLNGTPEFLESVSGSVLMLAVNGMLLRLGGTVAVAANAAVLYAGAVVMMLLDGVSNAMQPPMSYCYGAGLVPRVAAIEKWCLIICACIAAVVFLAFEWAGGLIMPLFGAPGDEEFVRLGELCIRIFSISYLFIWAEICLRVFLTALESAGRAFILSMARTVVFPLASLWACTRLWGLEGVWISSSVSAFASAALGVYFALSLWKNVRSRHVAGASSREGSDAQGSGV
ncbi:MAG: MATE family efflux transporter [Succinivibrio sp.]